MFEFRWADGLRTNLEARSVWRRLLRRSKLKVKHGRCYGEYGGSLTPKACRVTYFRTLN